MKRGAKATVVVGKAAKLLAVQLRDVSTPAGASARAMTAKLAHSKI
jgi:hypothetical protein